VQKPYGCCSLLENPANMRDILYMFPKGAAKYMATIAELLRPPVSAIGPCTRHSATLAARVQLYSQRYAINRGSPKLSIGRARVPHAMYFPRGGQWGPSHGSTTAYALSAIHPAD